MRKPDSSLKLPKRFLEQYRKNILIRSLGSVVLLAVGAFLCTVLDFSASKYPEAGMIFDKYNIPQIAMNWFGEQYNVDCVDGDWEYILDQLANQLVKRNYRKVGLQLNPERNSFISCRYQKNLSDWKKIIARYGITDYGNAWHNMMCDEPPEVIISFGEPVYKELHDFYSQRNLQLNIVNLNREIPEEKEIYWRYIGFDYRVIAVEGWKMLNMLINKQQLPERRKLIKFPSRILFNNTQE